jgi:hypothetical protein
VHAGRERRDLMLASLRRSLALISCVVVTTAIVLIGSMSSAQAYENCTVKAKSPYVDGVLTHHMNATGEMNCGQFYRDLYITVTLKYYYPLTQQWYNEAQRTYHVTSDNHIDNYGDPTQHSCVNSGSDTWQYRTRVEGSAYSKDGIRRLELTRSGGHPR